jgi:hypothetical protein
MKTIYCGISLSKSRKSALVHLVTDKDLLPADIYWYSEHMSDKTKKQIGEEFQLQKQHVISYLKRQYKAFGDVVNLKIL